MKNELIINKPIIEDDNNTSSVFVKVCIEEYSVSQTLWYRVSQQYSSYLTTEVADSFVVSLLLYAMKRGLDIRCESPVSSRLYLMISKYLIPFINQINNEMKLINIWADTYDSNFNGHHCGTGISCGVDSLSTFIQHGIEEKDPLYKIDTLTLLNTGYYGSGEESTVQYEKYISRSQKFSDDYGLKFLTVDSNISSITGYDFLSSHTYLTCSTVLLFQKYFRVYYYASGYPVTSFRPFFKDSAYYDIYLLNCISTESLDFISSCCTLSRVEKTQMIARRLEVFRSLYVCLSGDSSNNCSQCEKCIRTMLALEALMMKEKIADAFNLEIYEKNRVRYFSYMLRQRNRSVYYKEIYNTMKENGISIPIIAYINIVPCRFEIRLLKNKCKVLLSKYPMGRAILSWVKRA